MSFRVFLKSTFSPTGDTPNGLLPRYTLKNGADLVLSCEGGTFYFAVTTLDTPIHPEIRRYVAKITCHKQHTNPDMLGRIAIGTYVHGDFHADVRREGDGRNKMVTLVITASARSVTAMQRYLRELENGHDTPRPRKPPPATPTTSVSAPVN